MKVLQIYRTCYPETNGGIEQVIRYLAKGGIDLGVETKVLSLADSNNTLDFEGTEINLAKRDFSIKSNCFSFSLFSKAKELIDWADIIHFHYPWPSGDLLCFLVKDKPYIVTYHSDIVKQKYLKILYKPLENYFLDKSSRIVVTSKNYLDSSENLISYKEKCEIIPLGIDFNDYVEQDENTLERFKNSYGDEFFLFIGVLRYYKGLKYLIDAAAINGLPVVIAGKGPEFDNLKKQVKALGITNVHLVGFVTDLERNALLKLCRAFVFPSHVRSEAFGVSLIESLYFAKPIISCEIGTGTSFVNMHEESGIVIKPESSIDLSDAMVSLLESERWRKYSQGAKKRSELFSYSGMAEMYTRLYTSII